MPPYRNQRAPLDAPSGQFTPDIGRLVSPLTGMMSLLESRRQESAAANQASIASARQMQNDNLSMLLGFQREQRASRLQETQIAAEALRIGAETEANRIKIAYGTEQLKLMRFQADTEIRGKQAQRTLAPLLSVLTEAAAQQDPARYQFISRQLRSHAQYGDLPDVLRTQLSEEAGQMGKFLVPTASGDMPASALYGDALNPQSGTRLQSAAALLDLASVEFKGTLIQDLKLTEVEQAKVNGMARPDRLKLAQWRESENKKKIDAARIEAMAQAQANPDADLDEINDRFTMWEARERSNFMGIAHQPWADPSNPVIPPNALNPLIDRLARTPTLAEMTAKLDAAASSVREKKKVDPETGEPDSGIFDFIGREKRQKKLDWAVQNIRNDLGAFITSVYDGTVSPEKAVRGTTALSAYNALAKERGISPLDFSDLIPQVYARRARTQLARSAATYGALSGGVPTMAGPREPPPSAPPGGQWTNRGGQWLYVTPDQKAFDAGGTLLNP